MYELSVDSHFAAAHCLKGYAGECSRLHGHTWGVTVTVLARDLDDVGMSLDFKQISAALDDIVGRFDHQTLNDLDLFATINPTAENIARIVFDAVSEHIAGNGITVDSVTVAESKRYRVTYRKD